jgi:preprotein translocase subunit SecG
VIIYLLLTLHVVLSVALILIVLLQTGKGSDLASAFGGGGAGAVFGGSGPTSFLNKMTTAVAVLFMVTSISLAYVGTGTRSVMPDQRPEPVPAAGVEQDEPESEGLESDFETMDDPNTGTPVEDIQLPAKVESEPVSEDIETGISADIAPSVEADDDFEVVDSDGVETE